jgi:general secretion pathway protein L
MEFFPERFRRAAGDGLAWWLGELAAMVPAPLRRALDGRGALLILEEAGDELVVSRFGNDGCREIGRLCPDRPETAAEAARQLARLGGDRAELILRLPQDRALRRIVDLPLAAEENLAEVLRFEMARLTPFRAEQVYFAGRVLGRDAQARSLRVELTVVRRTAVDRLLERAGALGASPRRAVLAGEHPRSGALLDLAPDGDTPPGRASWGAPSLMLAGLAACLALTIVFLPLERRLSRAEAMAELVAGARAEAASVQEIGAEIDRVRAEHRFAFERRDEAPAVLAILNDLTERLPDDTWLLQLELREGELQISGYSPAASSLIGVVEGSPLFQNVRFRSPVTRDTRVGAEQFNLSAELVPDPAAGSGGAT